MLLLVRAVLLYCAACVARVMTRAISRRLFCYLERLYPQVLRRLDCLVSFSFDDVDDETKPRRCPVPITRVTISLLVQVRIFSSGTLV